MIPVERQEIIKRELEKNKFVSVSELAKKLGISISTVRRDLVDMENEGQIERTHGGAILIGSKFTNESIAHNSRAGKHIKEKQIIGKKVAQLVENAGCIILDNGTTTLAVARNLRPVQPLKVITDSIEIAYELRDRNNITVLITGGILRHDAYNLYGSFAEHMLDSVHAQVCILGASGFTIKEGLTKHDVEALPVRKKMVDISHKLICVVDSSKIGVTGIVSVCPAERVDMLITDSGIDSEMKERLENIGVEVIIVT